MSGISCIFENSHFYVLAKPAGVPFHTSVISQAGIEAEREASEVQSIPNEQKAEEGMVSLAKKFLNDEQIFPVHRLDKMTSGLMVFARHAQANRDLSMLFERKQIEKYYLALAMQRPKKKQGKVQGDMLKGRSGSYLLSRSLSNPAITQFFAEKITLSDDQPAWLFLLKPETGKTHQLRVALKSLSSPILGDRRYAGESASRGYLHAYRMRFDAFGQRYVFSTPDFEGAEFSLPDVMSTLSKPSSHSGFTLEQLCHPERMPWPKSAFKLNEIINIQ